MRPDVENSAISGESRFAQRGMFIFLAVASSTTPVCGRFANFWNFWIASFVGASSLPFLAPETRPATAAASSPSPSGGSGAPKPLTSESSR